MNYRFGGTGLVVTPPTANWAGFYLGVNAGGLLGRDPSALASVAPGLNEQFHLMPTDYTGGGQVGYNWQAGSWVFGLETDIQGSFGEDKDACIVACNAAAGATINQKLPWFGTARGRVGYSLGSTLFYGTAGFAYGQTRTVLTEYAVVGGVQSATFSRTRGGWTAGAGIESPLKFFGFFGPNWTAKTEYLYVDLGNTSNTFTLQATPQEFSTRTQEHIFRGGVNYHFSPVGN